MNFAEQLYHAARNRQWGTVKQLLADADAAPEPAELPPDCGGRNALYFALLAGEFDIAGRLYELGMRLDAPLQNCDESDSVAGGWILQFLSHEHALGRDYFCNETRTLADCCRLALLCQAETLLNQAPAEELAAALAVLPECFLREKSIDRVETMLDRLLARGAAGTLKQRSPEEFRELTAVFARIAQWPGPIAVDRPGELKRLAEKIQQAAER